MDTARFKKLKEFFESQVKNHEWTIPVDREDLAALINFYSHKETIMEALEYYACADIYRLESDVMGSGEVFSYIVANEECAKEVLEELENESRTI